MLGIGTYAQRLVVSWAHRWPGRVDERRFLTRAAGRVRVGEAGPDQSNISYANESSGAKLGANGASRQAMPGHIQLQSLQVNST